MPIGLEAYPDDILPAHHAAALRNAAQDVVAQLLDDLTMLEGGVAIDETGLIDLLPRRYLPRYDLAFARAFLVCVITVAWKLEAPGERLLACLAEELALHAIVQRASDLLTVKAIEPDFGTFCDIAFKDQDCLFLFDGAQDGIEDSAIGDAMGIVNLRFDDWFRPFYETVPVHPFVAQRLGGNRAS
ncbi:hypothetical protein ACFL59_03370 [Planctomycetota bacterium]